MNYSVFLKNTELKGGFFPVYIRLMHGRKSKYISLGVQVKELNWDENKKLVKRSDILHHKKNLIIKAYAQKADQILLENIINDSPLSLDNFAKKLKNKNLVDFFEFANVVIKRKTVSKSTLTGYNSAIQAIKSYKNNIIITDIDNSFLTGFKNHLINKKKENSTISLYISFISMILKEAVSEQIISINPVTNFKFEFVRNEKPYLSSAEIEILEKLSNTHKLKPTYKYTLKMFLFSCYTGIALSDLAKLTKDNIQLIEVDNKNYSMIFDNRQKTKNFFRVPLTEKAENIITEIGGPKNIFKKYSYMLVTNHMKKIREAAPDIKKHFTFHTARHSFGTYWASQGVSEKILMELMGHTETASNRIYSKIQDFTLINSLLNTEKQSSQ